MLAALIVGIAMQPAAAEPFYREDLRIPMETAGTRGLEAMLLRPSGTRRYPLALISHGTPREGAARAPMSPYGSYRQALEFARRGFAALVFMRRGYGDSGGQQRPVRPTRIFAFGLAVGQRSARGGRGHG
jgi:predicted acyl esterase